LASTFKPSANQYETPCETLIPQADAKVTMADHSSGLPLEAYTKSVPPGFAVGQTHFPFRRYLERLRLWYRLTDLDASQIGPAVAGRLSGRPFNLAMSLRIDTLGPAGVLVGDAALAFPGQAQAIDPQTGLLLQPAIESGMQQIIRVLQHSYGADDQQVTVSTIDMFLDLRRGRSSLLEYLNEAEHLYNEANSIGGFVLNDVGRSHMLLKHAGLDASRRDHIMLVVGNDLGQFQAIKGHLERLAKSHAPNQVPGSGGYHTNDQESLFRLRLLG
jgi:hypothetical protein